MTLRLCCRWYVPLSVVSFLLFSLGRGSRQSRLLSRVSTFMGLSKLPARRVHRYAELLAARRGSRYTGLPDGALAQDLNLLLLTDHACDYVLL